MTEYDYSPEAYERYLSTQRRIANWVDRTEDCRPQFANALAPPREYMPGHEDSRKAPGRRLQRRRSHHFRSRSPSIDDSDSDSEYEFVPSHPAPIPPPMRSAPGHLGGSFPQHQLPWNQPPPPMMAPQRTMPPSYYGAPSYHDQHRRRTHSQSHLQRHHYPGPPAPQMLYPSPPVSSGVYGYPAPPYVMMPQHHGRPMPNYLPTPC
ncbi:hypothetical protein DFP72DRAFT_8986 [Ephemerocybe angulata]|uniref:Uncharacterized protein n=1 Tax=Ephemerocybe angulata TaxID=980116 RepID=A0A8H6IKA6_9AGAR|nr:hypothetical protein DFP72DRAFT_8986 [Tulosesus angulatus]